MLRALTLGIALACAPLPVLAHKVIFSVFKSGDMVEGELGFSNGDMADGQVIKVFGQDGNDLGEAMTDQDGFFTFTPTQPITHVFKANLGAGHVAEETMPADDIAALLGVAAVETSVAATEATSSTTDTGLTVASLTDEERLAIAAAVRDEMRPLRRELAAYREKNDLQTILGGLGYIFGLFGLGFYIAARRRMAG